MSVSILTLLAAAGCAKRVPEPSPDSSIPHISWSIGRGQGDKEVCRSTEAKPCILDMSDTRQTRRLGDFHLFLHPAGTDTRYVGTMDVGFFDHEGETARVHSIDRIVPRGSDPIGSSSTGIVKAAGTYYVDVSLTATSTAAEGKSIPLKARIRVDVR